MTRAIQLSILLPGLLALASEPAAAQQPDAFAAREHFQTGRSNALALESGDLDGDGRDDMVATTGAASLIVYRGMASGSIEASGQVSSPAPVNALALGDVDGDARLDLAFAAQDQLLVALGNGSGGFGAAQPVGFLAGTAAVAVDDVDGDGLDDLAALSSSLAAVHVFLSLPSGGFSPPVVSLLGSLPNDLVLAHFDGDGDLDLGLADVGSASVVVALGDGQGVFAQTGSYPVLFGAPTSITAVFLDPGHHVDLVAASTFDASTRVLLGNGDGTFGQPVLYFAGTSVVLGDWDGDADTDVLGQNSGIRWLPGDGAGAFGAAERLLAPSKIAALSACDADGDGHLDLAFGAISDTDPLGQGDTFTKVGALFGDGSGGVRGVSIVDPDPAALTSSWSFASDVDSDGDPDAIGRDSLSGQSAMRRGDGAGGFLPTELLPVPSVPGLELSGLGDVNGDGWTDLVERDWQTVHVLLGTGGPFLGPISTPLSAPAARISVGDLNADGLEDVVVAAVPPAQVVALLSAGNGSFALQQVATNLRVPIFTYLFEIEDLDGDALGDLVVASRLEGVWTYRGLGDGSFAFVSYLPGSPFWGVGTLGDLDEDGLPDLVIGSYDDFGFQNQNTISVLRSDGACGFLAPAEHFLGQDAFGHQLSDLDGDGHLDLIANLKTGEFVRMLGDGQGGFGRPVHHAAPGGLLGAGDTDGDGQPDLVFSQFFVLGPAASLALMRQL